jgi:hypothetical protein
MGDIRTYGNNKQQSSQDIYMQQKLEYIYEMSRFGDYIDGHFIP